VLLVALAGCSSHGPSSPSGGPATDGSGPGGDGGSGNGTGGTGGVPTGPGGPLGLRLDMNDCHAAYVGFVADAAKLASLLPKGYTPAPDAPGVEQAALDVFECASLVIDNQTVVKDFRLEYVLASVHPPEDLATSSDGYVFELTVNHPAAQAAWAAAGFDAHLGSLELDVEGQTVQGSVTRDGQVVDAFQGAGETEPSSTPQQSLSRVHFADGSGRRAWVDIGREDTYTQAGAPVLIATGGGAVEAVAYGAPGQVPGEATLVRDHLALQFHRDP
jgi:hypothetical protein